MEMRCFSLASTIYAQKKFVHELADLRAERHRLPSLSIIVNTEHKGLYLK